MQYWPTSVTPNGIEPTKSLLACLVTVDPNTGTAAWGTSDEACTGIWPAAKIEKKVTSSVPK